MPGGVVEGPQKPRRLCQSRTVPGPPAPLAKKAGLAGERALGYTAGFTQRLVAGPGTLVGSIGSGVPRGSEHGQRWVIALSPLSPRARTGVIRPFRGTR